ncbi:MAG: transketolase family protein [Acetobacteraceae bacterium]|nr:transketolase family protein [Acetobacteraceae bacterium]
MGSKVACRDAYGRALVELGRENPAVVVLDADLSASTKTVEFARAFPERFFNAGIAEQNMMGLAAGLAAAGKVPFASTFAVFASGRAFDQVRMSIAYPGLGVKIVATHGGLTVGEDGASHQALEDLALMRALPGMTVIVPADAVETYQAVWAVAARPGPAYVRVGRSAVPVVFGADYRFEVGRMAVLRQGRDVAIIACGHMVALGLEAAAELARRGVEAMVLNASTIKPLDREAVVAAARATGAVVTAEDHSVVGGLGGAVAEVLGEEWPTPLIRVGVGDRFGESGPPAGLLEAYGMAVRHIVEAAVRVKGRAGGRRAPG